MAFGIRTGPGSGPQLLRRFPKWLAAAVLYGIAWHPFHGIPLAFLAWFAFVPLFADLESRKSFPAFYSRSLLFSVVAYVIGCHGFLITARRLPTIFAGAASELFLTSIPFALIYPLKKRYGFKAALTALPFVIASWEWAYQRLEHTTGYLMLSNSQSGFTWLIQYIDILGVWSIACWVTAFNVLIYFRYQKPTARSGPRPVRKDFIFIVLAMTIPPLCYAALSRFRASGKPAQEISVTQIHTRFGVPEGAPDEWADQIERLTFLTDSADYELKRNRLGSDLIVWPEGAIDRGNDKNVVAFLDSAVNDWNTPLLAGMRCVPAGAGPSDLRKVNRAALFTPGLHGRNPVRFYDKVRLFPVHERIPYHEILAKIPRFPILLNDPSYTRKGDGIRLIEFGTARCGTVRIGTPICQEQNDPKIWSEMALAGARCFIQLSSESWWTLESFKRQMAGITALRCIETRRSAARCSNHGVTAFIDAWGRVYARAGDGEGAARAALRLGDDGLTFFTRHPNAFPLFCLLMTAAITACFEVRKISAARRIPLRDAPKPFEKKYKKRRGQC